MAISVSIGGPKIDGLELMSPAVPEFDTAVRSLFRGNSDKLLKMKPFLTILSNHSHRTLVAYALKWEVARPTGRQITTVLHKYPDAVAPAAPRRGNEIRSGEQNIVLMSIELDCGRWGGQATEDFYLRQFIRSFKEYKHASALESASILQSSMMARSLAPMCRNSTSTSERMSMRSKTTTG